MHKATQNVESEVA